MNQITGFALGFSSPVRGLRLIAQHPRILTAALIPFVVGLIVILFGAFFGIAFLAGLLPNLVESVLLAVQLSADSMIFVFLYWFMLVLAWPMALAALLYFLFMIARLIAAPFFAFLAEKVLQEVAPTKRFHPIHWMRASGRMFVVSFMKLIVFTFVGAALFVFSLIPGLGLFTGFGFLLLLAYDIVDGSLEVFELSSMQRWSFFRDNFGFFSGLALALGLAFLIPGLNFVLLPIAIAGSADVVRQLLPQELFQASTLVRA